VHYVDTFLEKTFTGQKIENPNNLKYFRAPIPKGLNNIAKFGYMICFKEEILGF